MSSPAWSASMMQVPALVKETVPSASVQPALVAARLIVTGSPVLAVAVGVYVPPTIAGVGADEVKVTVCGFLSFAVGGSTGLAAAIWHWLSFAWQCWNICRLKVVLVTYAWMSALVARPVSAEVAV